MSKKTYTKSTISVFPESFKMELPDGYRIDTEYDDDFNEVYKFRGGFYINDEGVEDFAFSAAFINMSIELNVKEDATPEAIKNVHDPSHPDFAFNMFIEGVKDQLESQYGSSKCIKLFNSPPESAILKFYQPFSVFGATLDTYLIFYFVSVSDSEVFGFNSVQMADSEKDSDYYKHLLNVIKSVRVDGNAVDTGKLTPKKLQKALDLESNEDVEAMDLGLSLGINIQNGDDETLFTLNSDGSISEERINANLSYATPDESLYPHYNSMLRSQGLGMFGINVVVNSTGTEYAFYPIKEFVSEDASDEVKNAVAALNDTGAKSYTLDDRASEMRSVFHVSSDIFDTSRDRECELAEGYMHRAYMMSGLRSFAWTLAKYCKDIGKKPEDITLEQIQKIVDEVADLNWLNYDGKSECKGLCGTQDLHVFYLPDKTPKDIKKVFEPSAKELEETRKMQEQFPSYNPILSQVGSLDKLRKDLEYIYPAIEKLYDDLKSNRDINEPLTGNDADVLYAWCALAYAAREPFFSEDGPTMNFFSQIENEEEKRIKVENKRAENEKELTGEFGQFYEVDPHIEFKDKKFVFAGLWYYGMDESEQPDYRSLVENRGGLVRSKVSGVTDYLVIDFVGVHEWDIRAAIEKQEAGKPVKIIRIDDLKKALGLETDDSRVSAETVKPETKKVTKEEAGETVIVDGSWAVTVPSGFIYSTDKNVIGGHRNIIIMEDDSENDFEMPFSATISFTSMINDSQQNPAPLMAKSMVAFMGGGDEVIRDDNDLYVSYGYQPNRSYKEGGEKLDVFQMFVGCGENVSSIQVFFNNSKLARREQKKIVDKVAKSVKLAEEINNDSTSVETTSVSNEPSTTSASSTSALTPEQQRQKEELNSQLEDLRAQAAFYSSQDLSAEDRETLNETKKEIDRLSEQVEGISSDQAKFEEHLRRQEEQKKKAEEEKARRRAEILAKGDTDDVAVDMFVILTNEKGLGKLKRNQSEFCNLYDEDFPTLNKTEMTSMRKKIREKMKDEDFCDAYTEKFKQRSVKERFSVSTRNYYNVSTGDFGKKIEPAIDGTACWYSREEFKEVRSLMDEHLKETRKKLDDQLAPVEEGWTKFNTAKKDLVIVIKDEADINENNEYFQVKTGGALVEVDLVTGGLLKLSVNLMNCFPWYWDKEISEIWEAAQKNEIRDESTGWFDNDQLARQAVREIRSKYPPEKDHYWRKGSRFIQEISSIYQQADPIANPEKAIEETLKSIFSDERELGFARSSIIDSRSLSNIPALKEIMDSGIPMAMAYEEIPAALGAEIKENNKRKIEEIKNKDIQKAKESLNDDTLSGMAKTLQLLEKLNEYDDADSIQIEGQSINALIELYSGKIDALKETQYLDALNLIGVGDEESLGRAEKMLVELADFKDAEEKAKEAKSLREMEHRYITALSLSEQSDLVNVRKAETAFKELDNYKDSGERALACTATIERIKKEKLDKAIELDEEGSIESIKQAISILQDAGIHLVQVTEFKKHLDLETKYSEAVEKMQSDSAESVISAIELLDSLNGYKDSDEKRDECQETLDSMLEEYNGKAQELLSSIDYQVLTEVEEIYEYLKRIDYDETWLAAYDSRLDSINELRELYAELSRLNEEHSTLGGLFKRKQRLEVESKMQAAKDKVKEIWGALSEEIAVSEEEN